MAVTVYRCSHCGREVLVRTERPPGTMSEEELRRRVEEEFRQATTGAPGRPDLAMRLRDDIWSAISEMREFIPRNELPERCPACGRAQTLLAARDA